MFSKILIANRGEIAVRIIRACKEMGISTVAVFSEADRDAFHVSLADESYCIGAAAVTESYLNMGAILTVAVKTKSEAIHPGYGLLSENSRFAQLCEEHGIVFIGPSSEIISKMGDKDEARRTVRECGVPIIPGDEAGYPILLKARAGGGGRGIRIVKTSEEFQAAYNAASLEALNAFGDGTMYVEKYLHPVKHIEAQILCDNFGNQICLGTRDCSIQRKNQKLLEECPAPIDDKLKERIHEAALKIVKSIGYTGAGTIEFLIDKDKKFYFMEMNTRLQVEHSVTEMALGVDIVKWQIRIAAGYEIDFAASELINYAIECRIIAEDPMQNFRPNCGEVTLLHIPGGHFVRFDTALYQNYFIPPYYDSMIGKLIVGAKTREEAIRKMRGALSELVIEGVAHNSELQIEILSDSEFADGSYTTDFLTRKGYIK
ncbi:MAG: acetyl-CoA carboxylase biotin carboxylase subunit [Oscillospiraceae bacterium]|nr:acetyl-CoA carboxylase biotin carboxylase subunit [Oscillospiraceae bacterium]